MYKILKKRYLNPEETLFEMEIEAPLMSKKARGGNFVIVRLYEEGERMPLTVADYNREKGTITVVVQAIGKSTQYMSALEEGEEILDFVGPLGKAARIEKYDNPVVLIGGGVGIAPIYPQAKELKEAGNTVIVIMGARTKSLLFWKEKMKAIADEVIITTDDGSAGRKGFVTDALKELMQNRDLDRVIAIGPLIMMKFVADLTRGGNKLPHIPTTVSLNTIMVDGTGMCGGCRFQTLDGETKFACVDGPDVDGHNVDFDNVMSRNKRFNKQEAKCLAHYENKSCKLYDKISNEEET